jgi:LPS export ABC transporter protein LptC
MRARLGLAIIVLGVVVVCAALVVGLLHHPAPPPAGNAPGSASTAAGALTGAASQLKGDVTVQGSQLTKRDAQGNPVWALQAGSEIKFDPQRKVAEGKNAHWSLQSGTGPSGEWLVDAPEVLYSLDSGQVEFTGGVVIHSADGKQTFHAQRMVYVPAAQELRGEGPVEMVSGTSRVTADQMVIATDKHQVRLLGKVHFRLTK